MSQEINRLLWGFTRMLTNNPLFRSYESMKFLIISAVAVTAVFLLPFIRIIPFVNDLLEFLVFVATVLWMIVLLIILLSFTSSNFQSGISVINQIFIIALVCISSFVFTFLIKPNQHEEKEIVKKETLLQLKSDYAKVLAKYLYSENSKTLLPFIKEQEFFKSYRDATIKKIRNILPKKIQEKVLSPFFESEKPDSNKNEAVVDSYFVQCFMVNANIEKELKTLGSNSKEPPTPQQELPKTYTKVLENVETINKNVNIEGIFPLSHGEDFLDSTLKHIKFLKRLGDSEKSNGRLNNSTIAYKEIYNKLQQLFCGNYDFWNSLLKAHTEQKGSLTLNMIDKVRKDPLINCSPTIDNFSNSATFPQKASLQDLIDKS